MPVIREPSPPRPAAPGPDDVPLLQPGDCLTRDEFERRYERMRNVKKAELIEGVVYMPSPVRLNKHSRPHFIMSKWLGDYEEATPGVMGADNTTVRLDLENEPQPDLVLILDARKGGQTRLSADDYLEGAPELCIEIAASSAAYDVHQKKRAYRRNGVREYIAWLTEEQRILWWELREGDYHEITPDDSGILKSRVFPGLWLDVPALLSGNLKRALSILQRGTESADHTAFVERLASAG